MLRCGGLVAELGARDRCVFFFFQAEDGIRDYKVTGVQTCALPICSRFRAAACRSRRRPRSALRSREFQARARSSPLQPRRARWLLREARRSVARAILKDRKSVVEGKRGDLGGRRIIKKKKKRTRGGQGGSCKGLKTRNAGDYPITGRRRHGLERADAQLPTWPAWCQR